MIRDHDTRIGIVEAVVAHDSEAVVLRVGTIRISHISIGISLVNSFKTRLLLLM